MGLKARKIKTMLEEYNDSLADNFNSKFGSQFKFETNWEVVPSDIDGWNWENEDLKKCFLTNFYAVFEACFTKLWEDKDYKEAITEQVQTIKFEPGPESRFEFSFENGIFTAAHTMSVNYKDVERSGSQYIQQQADNMEEAFGQHLS